MDYIFIKMKQLNILVCKNDIVIINKRIVCNESRILLSKFYDKNRIKKLIIIKIQTKIKFNGTNQNKFHNNRPFPHPQPTPCLGTLLQ